MLYIARMAGRVAHLEDGPDGRKRSVITRDHGHRSAILDYKGGEFHIHDNQWRRPCIENAVVPYFPSRDCGTIQRFPQKGWEITLVSEPPVRYGDRRTEADAWCTHADYKNHYRRLLNAVVPGPNQFAVWRIICELLATRANPGIILTRDKRLSVISRLLHAGAPAHFAAGQYFHLVEGMPAEVVNAKLA